MKGQPSREEHIYELSDGLYEVCESNKSHFLAVFSDRRVRLTTNDLMTVDEASKISCISLMKIFNQWVNYSIRTRASFKATAIEMTEPILESKRTEAMALERSAIENQRQLIQTITAWNAFDGSSSAVRGYPTTGIAPKRVCVEACGDPFRH